MPGGFRAEVPFVLPTRYTSLPRLAQLSHVADLTLLTPLFGFLAPLGDSGAKQFCLAADVGLSSFSP